MSNLERYEDRLPDTPVVMPPLPLTRHARAVTQQHRVTELRARRDYDNARLAMHKQHLDTVVEKANNDQRAELVQHQMLKVVEVDATARALAQGREGLAITLGELQQAYNQGEVVRAVRRGFDF